MAPYTDYHNMLGKELTLTPAKAAVMLKHAICESILCADNDCPEVNNIYGRPVACSPSGDISFAVGFASTGLRAGIILHPGLIASSLPGIAYAARVHIPLVVFAGISSQFQVQQLSQAGAVVFSAATAAETLDLLVIAYKIAELSLIPVVVCMEEILCHTEQPVVFPGREILEKFAGNTDHLIPSPTPSQQIIFGRNRKRIPNWFNTDQPVAVGAAKDPKESLLEMAAQQEYFYGHLDNIIGEAFKEFGGATGRIYADIALHNSKDAAYLVISFGGISGTVINAIDTMPPSNKNKTATARLIQLSPFPERSVRAALVAKKAVTILEQATAGMLHSPLFKEVSCLAESRELKIFSGNYGPLPSAEVLSEVINNMLPGGKGTPVFWIDMEFTHPGSTYPKHQVLMQAIEREYPDVQNKSVSLPAKSGSSPSRNSNIPLHIRKYRDHGPAYTKLSRFYDDTASFFLSNPEELAADPFQAIPVMPPSTANFKDSPLTGKLLPIFIPPDCTGCGDCFLHCPHSAINPLATGVEALIKSGISLAATRGAKITQLTPLVKTLSKNIHETIVQHKGGPISVPELLGVAFEHTAMQMKLEGDKLLAARQDMEALADAVKSLPVSVTDVFYKEAESVKKGSGELFSLAIDVNACTGCGVCASVCREEALEMKEADMELYSSHQATFDLWEQLPDTVADTIIRLIDEDKYHPFSAILLSRHFNLALNGSSNDPAGDASKSMVHLLTAVAEASVQPRIKEAIRYIEELVAGLSEGIHTQLGAALPSHDFDALSKILSDIKEDRKPFDEVIGKLSSGEHLKLVDTKSLKRKVELAKSLSTLSWLLGEGANGTGRARIGMALDGSLKWSNSYPWNNFTSPVLIHIDGSVPEIAMGMVQGHIRQLLDNIKLIRRAELEMEGKYEPEINDVHIAALSWNDLTEKEKSFVPPIILIGSRDRLAGKDQVSLISLLDGDWPVKAIVLDDAAPGTDHAGSRIAGGIGSLLPALAMGKVQVLKSSLAVPRHLFMGLTEIFNSSRPALAWVFVPAMSKHVMPLGSYPVLHALSLDARAFPVFNYDPGRKGALLSSKIDLAENPQSGSIWMHSGLTYKENGEEISISYALTWADWAYTLKAWREKFIPYTGDMGKPVPVPEFLALPGSERAGMIPVIYRIEQQDVLVKYKVHEEVIRATEACVKAWQVLREMSGELSEFPEKLQQKVETELSEKYEMKMAEIKKEYEVRMEGLEREHLEKIRVKLKEKLITLSRLAKQAKT